MVHIQSDGRGSSERIAAGSRLILTQDVAIPDGWARVAIQDGTPIRVRSDIERGRPYCELVTQTVSRQDNPQVVKADEFVASEVRYRRSTEVDDETRDYTTTIHLESQQQPSVQRLTCEKVGHRMFTGDLTIDEIRQVLGGLIELQLAN